MRGLRRERQRRDERLALATSALGTVRLQLEPLVGADAAALARADVRTVQTKTRVTFRYELDGEPWLYCKIFSDAAVGAASHESLLGLWRNGFGAGARCRVAEPLGWLPEPRALVTRAAPGVSLWERIGAAGDGDGTRLAADWLLSLHATPFRVGRALDGSAEVLGLTRRIARVVAGNPGVGERLGDRVGELQVRARQVVQPQPTVQTHGTYNPWHLLVSDDATIALDLDESRPAAPAADLAEFVHWLRYALALGDAGLAAADRATARFLTEYGRERPIDAASLSYEWSLHLLRRLVNALAKPRRTQRAEERLRFYEREFAMAPERARSF